MPTILQPEQIDVVSRVLDRQFGRRGHQSDPTREDAAALALQFFGLGTEDEEDLLARLRKALSCR